MLTLLFSFALNLAVSSAPANVAPVCEAHANSVTGITVTVCDGSVVRACDSAGNCHGPVSSY